jgi:hypothetical protein
MRAWKLTTGLLGATALVVVLASAPALAQNKHGGGGPPAGGGAPHGGGGGAPHFGGGGGAPHFGGGGGGGGAPHMAAPQISAAPHVSAPQFHAAPQIHAAPHFSGPAHISAPAHIGGAQHLAAPRFGGGRGFAPHVSMGRHASPQMHFGRSLRGPTGAHTRTATHVSPFNTHGAHGSATLHGAPFNADRNRTSATNHTATNGRTTGLHASVNHLSGAASAQNFAAHRNFARVGALRPFLNDPWHRRHHNHLGWIGPVFWPYAYGDVFYYALWPYEYAEYDPFWAYGYGDVYQAIFPTYDYGTYVRGRGGASRMTALRNSVAQSCTDEAAEVTGWPIDQIQAAVQPDQQQLRLLDDLGNAVVKASAVIKSHCPQQVAFTAPARLADMQERLAGLVQAIDIVQPPLAKFYDALNDEQRARFNALGERQPPQGQQTAQNLQNQCGENAVAWPAEQIGQVVRPNDDQRAKLDALDAAAREAADGIKAACPSELPATPPDRLAAEGQRLQAILHAVQTVRPKLDAFYASLSNEQKARFNTIGRHLFVER